MKTKRKKTNLAIASLLDDNAGGVLFALFMARFLSINAIINTIKAHNKQTPTPIPIFVKKKKKKKIFVGCVLKEFCFFH